MNAEEFYNRFEFNPSMSGSLLGRGGFSSVHKAYDKWRKRYVAIKKSEVGAYAKFDLLREVKLANEVEYHPNVIRYENVERISDRSGTYDYAILKYYELGNLDQVLGTYVLTDKDRRQILIGILRGLGHLHRIPIIHRDFKAANVLMDRDKDGNWIPVIADFGLSRLVDADRSYVLDNSQIAVTPNYASPEQYGENVALRPNTDLWAFGVMTYKMMTGRLPFRVEDIPGDKDPTSKIKDMVLAGKLPDDVRNVPEPYRSLVLKCLVVDPVKRVKRAEELLDMLNLENKSDLKNNHNAEVNNDTTKKLEKNESRPPEIKSTKKSVSNVENTIKPVELQTRKTWPWQSALLIVSLFFLVVVVSIYFPNIIKRFAPRILADTAALTATTPKEGVLVPSDSSEEVIPDLIKKELTASNIKSPAEGSAFLEIYSEYHDLTIYIDGVAQQKLARAGKTTRYPLPLGEGVLIKAKFETGLQTESEALTVQSGAIIRRSFNDRVSENW